MSKENKLSKLITDFLLDAKDNEDCQIQGIIDHFVMEEIFEGNDDKHFEDDYQTRDLIVEKIMEGIRETINKMKL